MGRVQVTGKVPLEPAAALELWSDPRRWPAFVEGFQRIAEQGGTWPAEGARITWESGAGGRGRVTERVTERSVDRFVTWVAEERLVGTQTLSALPAGEETAVQLRLEYELADRGPLRAVADVLFIRRALRDALTRTLRRYAVEAQDQAGLR